VPAPCISILSQSTCSPVVLICNSISVIAMAASRTRYARGLFYFSSNSLSIIRQQQSGANDSWLLWSFPKNENEYRRLSPVERYNS
jgi:hypothetical protein